jgi:N4-gp56 family major capsid protein
MSDVMTTTASLESVQDAYDRFAYFQLRDFLLFDQVADVKPTKQAMPGDTVKFTLYDEMAPATSALNESVDVDAVALSDGQVDVVLTEYGNAAMTTAKLMGTSFLNVETDKANLIGWNAGDSQDIIARTPLQAGDNVRYAGQATARNTVIPTDEITAHDVRYVKAKLRGASVAGWFGSMYASFIDPDVAVDLREETGAAAWRDPHTYSKPDEIWMGEVGSFEGFRFVETPRAPVFADAGSSTTLTDVYATLFVGRQALAKAYSSSRSAPTAKVVVGPVTDKLKRFHPLGWYWLGGYDRFREQSLWRVESAASIGDNAP